MVTTEEIKRKWDWGWYQKELHIYLKCVILEKMWKNIYIHNNAQLWVLRKQLLYYSLNFKNYSRNKPIILSKLKKGVKNK